MDISSYIIEFPEIKNILCAILSTIGTYFIYKGYIMSDVPGYPVAFAFCFGVTF